MPTFPSTRPVTDIFDGSGNINGTTTTTGSKTWTVTNNALSEGSGVVTPGGNHSAAYLLDFPSVEEVLAEVYVPNYDENAFVSLAYDDGGPAKRDSFNWGKRSSASRLVQFWADNYIDRGSGTNPATNYWMRIEAHGTTTTVMHCFHNGSELLSYDLTTDTEGAAWNLWVPGIYFYSTGSSIDEFRAAPAEAGGVANNYHMMQQV